MFDRNDSIHVVKHGAHDVSNGTTNLKIHESVSHSLANLKKQFIILPSWPLLITNGLYRILRTSLKVVKENN
jgi:hypothetical protein